MMFNKIATKFTEQVGTLTGCKLFNIAYSNLANEKMVSFSPVIKTLNEALYFQLKQEGENYIFTVYTVDADKPSEQSEHTIMKESYRAETLSELFNNRLAMLIQRNFELFNVDIKFKAYATSNFILSEIFSGNYKRYNSLVIIRTQTTGELEELEYTINRGHSYANIKIDGDNFLVSGKEVRGQNNVIQALQQHKVHG